ncbi:MAG: hypothetical protein ACJARD_001614 [Alphaproteobacteria bacterium]|jgi:hypothetical protein
MSILATNHYTDTLDSIYEKAKNNLNKKGYSQEINKKRATAIIKKLGGVEFGDYKIILTDAIIGMTQIEAFIYLNQVLKYLDEADGNFDGKINTGDNSFEEFMLSSAFLKNHTAIQKKLMDVAQEFKKDNNPTDIEYIAYIEQKVAASEFNAIDNSAADLNGDNTISTSEFLAFYGLNSKDEISHNAKS